MYVPANDVCGVPRMVRAFFGRRPSYWTLSTGRTKEGKTVTCRLVDLELTQRYTLNFYGFLLPTWSYRTMCASKEPENLSCQQTSHSYCSTEDYHHEDRHPCFPCRVSKAIALKYPMRLYDKGATVHCGVVPDVEMKRLLFLH